MARTKEKKKVSPTTFQEGDLVFAKLRGFKAWPSRVIEVAANSRYQVFFYGTHQTCYIGGIDLEPFNDSTLAKYKDTKTKYFKESLDEIQEKPEIFLTFMPSAFPDVDNEKADEPSELDQVAEALKASDSEILQQKTPRSANKRKAAEKEKLKANEEDKSNSQNKDALNSSPVTKVPVVDKPCSDPKMYYEIPGSLELVEVEIGRNKPKFKSPEEEAAWNKGSVKNLAILQEALKTGNYLPEEVRLVLKAKATRTSIEEELLKIPQHKPISEVEILLLKEESKLIDLNFDVRESLSVGNIDMSKGLSLLNSLNSFHFTKLQILKNPEVEETCWELMAFYEEDKYSNSKPKVEQARKIRETATMVHQKIRQLFAIQDEDAFRMEFPKIVEKFQNATKDLPGNERHYLTEIPQTFTA